MIRKAGFLDEDFMEKGLYATLERYSASASVTKSWMRMIWGDRLTILTDVKGWLGHPRSRYRSAKFSAVTSASTGCCTTTWDASFEVKIALRAETILGELRVSRTPRTAIIIRRLDHIPFESITAEEEKLEGAGNYFKAP